MGSDDPGQFFVGGARLDQDGADLFRRLLGHRVGRKHDDRRARPVGPIDQREQVFARSVRQLEVEDNQVEAFVHEDFRGVVKGLGGDHLGVVADDHGDDFANIRIILDVKNA